MRWPKFARVVLLGAATFPLVVCDDVAKEFGYTPAQTGVTANSKRTEPGPPPMIGNADQRFIPQAQSFSVALDTRTGQLCKTWGWTDNHKRPRGLPLCSDLANRANVYGMFYIGLLYNSGNGVPRNYAEAVRWFRKAAEQGSVSAQLSLGKSYSSGTGVAQDYGEAIRWYREAAEQGSATGQLMLGTMYGMGQGVPQDDAESYFWLYLAAPTLGDDVRKVRDEIGGNLTQAKRLEIQERCREWVEEHSQTHN